MKFVQLLFLWNVNLVFTVNVQFNMSQFYRMPTLNRFDNYHECMGVYGEEALYCIADAFIKPDSNSEVYNLIADYNRDVKTHFRHDNLVRGLCVNKCRQLIEKFQTSEENYLVEKFEIDSKIIYDSVDYFNAKEDRVKYADLINKCVNIEMMEKYKLKAFSSIEYCITEFNRPPPDALDIFALVFIMTLLFVVILSSIFDRFLRNLHGPDAEYHYKNLPETTSAKILTLFSVRRNWYTLTAPTNSEYRDLRIIQGIRAMTIFIAIIGHLVFFTEFLPSDNPEANEGGYKSLLALIIFNGFNIAQTFLFISGFFASYLFFSRKQNEKVPSLVIFVKVFILRYIRLVPLLAIAMLLHATWLYRLVMGPIANKVIYAEQQFCRTHWWKTLLFIDNYTNIPEKCLIQTWYLPCEFWLSAAGIVYLLIIRRIPKLKNLLLWTIIVFAGSLSGYICYVKKLEPVGMYSPETMKNRVVPVTSDIPNYFADFHTETHLNIGGYFIGIAAGLMFYNLKKHNKTLQKTIFRRFFWHFSVIYGFLNVLSAYIFYNYDFEKPSIWLAVTSVFLKYSWSVLFGYVIFASIYRIGWFIPDIFNHPVWTVLGRLSYAMYIFHGFPVYLIIMDVYQPVHVDLLRAFSLGLGAIVMSIFMALFFTLSVELPIASLVKILINQPAKDEEPNDVALRDIAESAPMKGG